MIAFSDNKKANETSVVCFGLLKYQFEISLGIAVTFLEAALLKKLEDVWSGQVALARAINTLEHLHRAELRE